MELSPKQSPNSCLIDADLLYGFTSADDIESGGEREGGLAGGSGEAVEALAEQGVDLYAGGCRKTDVECAVSGIDTCGGGYGGVADGGEDVHLARGRLATAVHALGGDHGLTLLMDAYLYGSPYRDALLEE